MTATEQAPDLSPLPPGTRVQVRADAYLGGAEQHRGRTGVVVHKDDTPQVVRTVATLAESVRIKPGAPLVFVFHDDFDPGGNRPRYVAHSRDALMVLGDPGEVLTVDLPPAEYEYIESHTVDGVNRLAADGWRVIRAQRDTVGRWFFLEREVEQ